MTKQEFDNKREELGIKGTGVESTALKDITWSHKETKELLFSIPTGARVHIWFSPRKYSDRLFVEYNGEIKLSLARFGHKRFTGLKARPSDRTINKYVYDSVVKSLTGKKVEPDGWGPDGAPSWLLVLGLI